MGRMISGDVARRVASSQVVLDWLPVLVVAPILIIDAAISAAGKPLTAVNVLSAFVACLPLGLRRHVSFPLLFPLVVAGVVLVLWQLHPANTVVIIPMVVLFHLALSGDRRRSLWMGLAIVPCVVISVIPFASGFSHITSIVVRNVALCLLAIAAGDVLRTRRVSERRMVEAAEQRTLRQVGEERLRIAREIHDLVAHAMTAINVQAGVAAHLLERDPHQAYDALRDIKQTSGDALTELRSTLDVLRDPTQAAPLGPVASLADIDELTAGLRTAGVQVDVDVDVGDDVPAAVQSAGYRIVQEALTNVARHADASSTRVCVKRASGEVTIEVVDDGARGGDAAAGSRQRPARDARARDGAGRNARSRARRRRRLAGVGPAAGRACARWPSRSPSQRPGREAMITVELADDQALVRAGFHALLDAEADIAVVAEAADGEAAVVEARKHRPDVVLMDIRMPRADGLQATAEITRDRALADTRVVVLTTFELDEYVFGALRAGASGFLLKDIEPADLVTAVRVVAAGEALLAPRLTRRLIEAFVASSTFAGAGSDSEAASELHKLTPREREVLTLVGGGRSNSEIAEQLVLSPLTVKTHVARLFAKLEARDRAQLVVAAYESGLVVPGTRAGP